jgi:hypothetical protein
MHLQLYRDGVSTAHAINDVDLGIRLTAGLLGQDLLQVHESCEGFIEEVTGYCWDDKKAEKGEDAPIKVEDHSLDAARYVIASSAQVWGPLLRSTLHLAA